MSKLETPIQAKVKDLENGLCVLSEGPLCRVMNRKCYIHEFPNYCVAIKNEKLARKLIENGIL